MRTAPASVKEAVVCPLQVPGHVTLPETLGDAGEGGRGVPAAAEAAADRPVMVVLRGLGLGDLLTAVPALRALRRSHPGHRIVLAAPSVLAPLVPLIGGVDEVCDVSGPGHVPPLGRRVDVAVNLHGGGPHGIAALHRTGPARLLTHSHPAFPGVRGPAWQDGVHEVRRWCDLLAWYGITADPADLGLRRPGSREEEARPVVIHPGAGYPARRWPPERFALVAAELRRNGHEVVVTGSARERDLAERVAMLAGLPPSCVLAGRTGLCELAALVARARLVVCGDTGVTHLAAAFATPSVALFGPVAPAVWGPPQAGPHVVLWAGGHGDPHAYRPDPGLLEIGVRDVLGAAARLLEAAPRAWRGSGLAVGVGADQAQEGLEPGDDLVVVGETVHGVLETPGEPGDPAFQGLVAVSQVGAERSDVVPELLG
ncbi:glycosyltransferase family 9 protein [Streptosporangium sp. NBC_01755]|uniref:glycosyltransferase family 9 protein n=1 Tax=unclassified Streptosporangium TaxID=2632669 RepID=UPI002DD801D9|nr:MULTISPECIES: glycosyltransferase family 9 protein [unclassified Streptosporangium]WSA23117.1 glycosyltransferase family 9 protein [Streptosporangium sp. NBC_01810]WSC98738.1 glycosyltransferase family 9 protein [Streptosporangium sp. NBC_01755]